MGGIVIDIDGVVADSEKWLIKHIEESSGKKLWFTDPRTFQFNIDISNEDLLRYIDEAVIKYENVIEPLLLSETYMTLLILEKIYGNVNFLSSRSNGDVEASTRFWLNNNFPRIKYNLYHIGESTSKYEWMKANGFDSIVDDRFKTVNECDFVDGLTFLVNQPWNIGRQEDNHVIRVNNLHDAVIIYLKLEKILDF